jgi:uncharacterized membrane protein
MAVTGEPEDGEVADGVGVERILAFSDGVFAIAITLLVLDLHVPADAHDLWRALRDAWPHYLSYTLSFATIGIIWAQHHGLFRLIRRSDHVFLLINVLFLLWLAALPFPTAVLAEYLGKEGERTAMLFYSGMWIVGTIPFNLLWRYAARGDRLLKPDVDRHWVVVITRSYLLGPVFYIVAFLAALVSVPASLVLVVLLALFYAVTPIPAISRLRFLRPLTGVPPPESPMGER